jgi:hypothetical protein
LSWKNQAGAYGNFLEALSKGHIIIDGDLSRMVALSQFVLNLWVTNGSVSSVDIIYFLSCLGYFQHFYKKY